jgi:hypothetical protein
MKFVPQICAGVLAAALMTSAAHAAVTRYDITATASGTLNGVAFTDQSLDLVLMGDPATLTQQNPFPGFIFEEINPLVSVEAEIAGVGNATLNVATRLGMADAGSVENTLFLAPADGLSFDLVDMVIPSDFATFSFQGPLAPVDAVPFLADFGNFQNVKTSLGLLTFTDASNAALSISAPAPEPATWAMFLTGFTGMGILLRRRQSQGHRHVA